jgi:hypothetical protein
MPAICYPSRENVLGRCIGAMTIALACGAAPASATPLAFSAGVIAPASATDTLSLGNTPSGTPAGLLRTTTVAESFLDGTVDSLSFSGGGVSQPAGLYLGITSKQGGPTAPFAVAGQSVTGAYAAVPVGGVFNLSITGAQPQTNLTLLWGSVDGGNELTFFDGGTAVATLTGEQITASVAGTASAAGIGGTQSFYVSVSVPGGFDDVQGSTTSNWFEVDSLGTASVVTSIANSQSPIPEPTGMGLVALLGTMAVYGRRRLPVSQVSMVAMPSRNSAAAAKSGSRSTRRCGGSLGCFSWSGPR